MKRVEVFSRVFRKCLLSGAAGLLIFFASACGSDRSGWFEKTAGKDIYVENVHVGRLGKTALLQEIKSIASKIDKAPVDAVLDPETWKVAGKEQSGTRVDVQKTVERVLSAEPGSRLRAVTVELKPRVTSDRLLANVLEIGAYSTPLIDDGPSRVNNIGIAADYIDRVIVRPGEEFSFNGTVGARTQGKGYEKAPVIIKSGSGSKKVQATGGGVCQVSSTLYNAVLDAGFKVTERHPHSKAVGYVPKGKDATVSYGSSDFKFVNTHRYPVMVRTYVSESEVTVKLLENRNP